MLSRRRTVMLRLQKSTLMPPRERTDYYVIVDKDSPAPDYGPLVCPLKQDEQLLRVTRMPIPWQ